MQGNQAPLAPDPVSTDRVSSRLARIALLLATVGTVGCGSSSSGSAFDEFLGTWLIDPNSTFILQCPGAADQTLALWGSDMIIEPGTLTDLIETSGICRFNLDVSGKVASVASPDPFTATAPECLLATDLSDGTHVDVQLRPSPSNWDFNLLMPVKGDPPHAQLLGTATWLETDTPLGGQPQIGTCMYVVSANVTKIARH